MFWDMAQIFSPCLVDRNRPKRVCCVRCYLQVDRGNIHLGDMLDENLRSLTLLPFIEILSCTYRVPPYIHFLSICLRCFDILDLWSGFKFEFSYTSIRRYGSRLHFQRPLSSILYERTSIQENAIYGVKYLTF